MDAKQVWRAALGELQVSLSPANFETWLRDTQLVDVDEQRFRIAVPNGFAKDWLESRYRSLISQTLARIVGYSVQVEFVIGTTTGDGAPAALDDAAPASPATNGHATRDGSGQQVRLEPTRVGGEGGTTYINPRYTFANFIVGSANRLAHAASLSVAERPGHAYNPLFLYGGVGLGKTHLMHAIGNQVIAKFPRKRVVYATSEKFTNEFIASIQQGKIDEFRARYRRIDLLLIDDIQFIADKERTQEEFFHTFNAIRYDRTAEFRAKYRNIDLLLIDDIQFISGKERTQEEFFHTFNDLYEAHRQIVLSSDSPPKEIPDIEERLRSRFEWGLIADIQPPDFETRVAILKKKAELERVRLPDEVAYLIARRIKANIREIEGSLTRMIAFCSLTGREMSIDLAHDVLADLWGEEERIVTIDHIQRKTAEFFAVKLSDMRAKNRTKAVAFPRQIAMFLARQLTHSSLAEVGRAFGGKDHTTVIHAVEKIESLLQEDPKLRRTIDTLTQAITQ